MRLPWIVRAAYQPDVELDLLDRDGKPDHSKVIGFVAFGVDVFLIVIGKTPPAGIFLVINAVVFGWVGMRTLLKSRTVTSTESNLNVTTKTVSVEERIGWDSEREYQAS